jgi:adenylyl-sulfate kinase
VANGFTLWLTGLSGAGKSTIAGALRRELLQRHLPVEILDGDEVRTHLSRDLGFSKADRDGNVRRIGYVARLLSRNGVAVIVAAISPYREARELVRREHDTPFIEVHVDCRIDELVRRDTKGLYAKALAGEIGGFTGVSDPYEPPVAPDLRIRTDDEDFEVSCASIMDFLERRSLVPEGLRCAAAPAAACDRTAV